MPDLLIVGRDQDGDRLVRCWRGAVVGPVHPFDGYLVKLAADLAADLEADGDGVRVADPALVRVRR